MKTRISKLTLAVLFALGAFGIAAPSNAADWADTMSNRENETGTHSASSKPFGFLEQARPQDNVTGTEVASSEPHGFLEQARSR